MYSVPSAISVNSTSNLRSNSQKQYNNSTSSFNINNNNNNTPFTSIASIGILNLTFTLSLTQTQAKQLQFNINDYNCLDDLEKAFYPSSTETQNINYEDDQLLDYVTLSSNDILLSTLLYLNRCSKIRFFIEFITLNDFDLTPNQLWIRSFIQDVTERNFLFLMHYNINQNIKSHFEFILKIIDDETPNNKVIHYKKFDFIPEQSFPLSSFTNNTNNNSITTTNNNNNESLFYLFTNFNFTPHSYFISDCSQLFHFKTKEYEELTLFFYLLTSKNQSIKIITLFTNEFLLNLAPDSQLFDTIKEIINLTDIILSEQSGLRKFYSNYNELYEIPWNQRDICILSDKDKKRKIIRRVTTLINYPKTVTAVSQKGINMDLDERRDCNLNLTSPFENDDKKEEENILESHKSYFLSFFFGAFLNRIITNKTVYSCVTAGVLLMKKMLDVIKYDLADSITNLTFYQITVPKVRIGSFRENTLRKQNKLNRMLKEKENGFVLDCLNKELSQKKDYNSLYDTHCSSFLTKKNTKKILKRQHLLTTGNIQFTTNNNIKSGCGGVYNNKLGNNNNNIFKNNKHKTYLSPLQTTQGKSLFIQTQYNS